MWVNMVIEQHKAEREQINQGGSSNSSTYTESY